MRIPHATCTIAFTILIAMRMPSKEPRYNWGNLMMHVFILYFYFIGHLLSPRVVTENSAFELQRRRHLVQLSLT
eukprot:COSAG06_NODE_4957_length_3832_cov_14.437450_6_plen_74_part_00